MNNLNHATELALLMKASNLILEIQQLDYWLDDATDKLTVAENDMDYWLMESKEKFRQRYEAQKEERLELLNQYALLVFQIASNAYNAVKRPETQTLTRPVAVIYSEQA